jgi:ATP-dependent RNA helicase DDX10/DBP4
VAIPNPLLGIQFGTMANAFQKQARPRSGGRGRGRGGARRPRKGGRGHRAHILEQRKAQKAAKYEQRLMQREAREARELEARIAEEAPASGTAPQDKTLFSELPLSQYTLQALKEANFVTMTQIQRVAIAHALAGRDVLGAAKTGSGKTLAFLVPILEKLFRLRWSREDGLAALVVSPTRELAFQIFEVVRLAGRHHSFSAGLVIGGKDLREEQERIHGMNLLVCTPGRLLQHLEQTPGFNADSLEMLVLDEADRILDMGFSRDVNAILEYLPNERQTLLFSATQTAKVKELRRLALRNPEYVAVHEKAEFATPRSLDQRVVVAPLDQKMDVLFSFIKTHLRNKVLVFLSSCKQVQFVHAAMSQLRPGVPLMCLHGKMKQMKRMGIYYDFLKREKAVLFATDIAARGLDFQSLDWVLQVRLSFLEAVMFLLPCRILLLSFPHSPEKTSLGTEAKCARCCCV